MAHCVFSSNSLRQENGSENRPIVLPGRFSNRFTTLVEDEERLRYTKKEEDTDDDDVVGKFLLNG
jgi:hypothetical protein